MTVKKLILEIVVFCLVAVVVVPILVALFIFGKIYVLEYFTRIEFNQVVWRIRRLFINSPTPE